MNNIKIAKQDKSYLLIIIISGLIAQTITVFASPIGFECDAGMVVT
jgi:hypothetical protein